MLSNHKLSILPTALMLVLAGCATVPQGPSVAVFPGTGKNFEDFRADDAVCRQYAGEQIGGANAGQNANDSAVRSGVVGTLIGAVAGAAIGGRQGAAVGAGSGLLIGSADGAGSTQHSANSTQRRYDIGYQQCMYAKGNLVPAVNGMRAQPAPPRYGNIPGPNTPPPPNYPPPPDAPLPR